MSDVPPLAPLPSAGEPGHYRIAFEATAAERAALRDSELVPLNLDVMDAVSTANSAMASITRLRSQLVAQHPALDPSPLDRVQGYAWALHQSHLHWCVAVGPRRPEQEMAARASALRRLLLSDARALARRAIIHPSRLEGLTGRTGFRSLAFDLLALALVLRDQWSDIASRSMVTEAELREAETLGRDIFDAVSLREKVPATVRQATRDRAQAFTLFWRAYDEARRLAVFVRWREGDADTLVPSLYAGRGGRGKKASRPEAAPGGVSPAPDEG